MNARLQEQIAATAKRLAELKAKQAAHDRQQQAREKAEARKADARKKLLLGVAVEHAIAAGLVERADVLVWCDLALVRPADREALGLGARV